MTICLCRHTYAAFLLSYGAWYTRDNVPPMHTTLLSPIYHATVNLCSEFGERCRLWSTVIISVPRPYFPQCSCLRRQYKLQSASKCFWQKLSGATWWVDNEQRLRRYRRIVRHFRYSLSLVVRLLVPAPPYRPTDRT